MNWANHTHYSDSFEDCVVMVQAMLLTAQADNNLHHEEIAAMCADDYGDHAAGGARPGADKEAMLAALREIGSAFPGQEVLEISVAAVKSRLHRSRLYLRDRLTQLYGKRGNQQGADQ